MFLRSCLYAGVSRSRGVGCSTLHFLPKLLLVSNSGTFSSLSVSFFFYILQLKVLHHTSLFEIQATDNEVSVARKY